MVKSKPVIELKNVAVFQRTKPVLSDVELDLQRGEFVYLIGKVGSGKSTLLKTLYAELPLQKGEAYVAGYNLNTLKTKEIPYLRRKLGIVFQDFQLLTDRNVYDNLAFVLKATGWKRKSDIDAQIAKVLQKVELSDKKQKMPHQLSGGEQQRITIARALLNDPEIILADEPTGNLDPNSSRIIMKVLLNFVKNGRSVLMATHNYSIINRYGATVFKCENGKVMPIGAWELETER